MKRADTINLTVQMPVADVMNTLAPQIDDIVITRVAEIRAREDGVIRSHRSRLAALNNAMETVAQAVARFDRSQHGKDERAATANLIAAAKGFNKAYRAYKAGI